MRRFIYILLVLLTACSAFPAEKTLEGTATHGEVDYSVIIDFEHEETPITLTPEDYALIAHLLVEAWEAHPELKTPKRMYSCINNSYHIVADRQTVNNLCDMGDGRRACSYTRRNMRLGERRNSPFDKISIYKEDVYADCVTATVLAVHEYLHHMIECFEDRPVVDRGDPDHSRSNIWWSAGGDDTLEIQVWDTAMETINNEVCNFPLEPSM